MYNVRNLTMVLTGGVDVNKKITMLLKSMICPHCILNHPFQEN